MSEPLVRVKKVSRVFSAGQSEVWALREVSLEVPPGVLYAVVGRSGSGKTTLLNLVGGLDRPTSGEISFQGESLNAMSESQLTELRRRSIGFVFQSFALFPLLSAHENVELPLQIAGVPRLERAQKVREALELVGLGARARHRPYELSGGEQQRVAIARAIVTRPQLVIADEPTGELDTTTGAAMLELFLTIVREHGLTVLIATHDRSIYERTSAVQELTDGRIGELGELAAAALEVRAAVARTIFGQRRPWDAASMSRSPAEAAPEDVDAPFRRKPPGSPP